MPTSISTQDKVNKFVDKALKKTVDDIVYHLEKKYHYNFSPATILELVTLTIEFSKRLTNTVNSEDLMEPEYFENNNLNR